MTLSRFFTRPTSEGGAPVLRPMAWLYDRTDIVDPDTGEVIAGWPWHEILQAWHRGVNLPFAAIAFVLWQAGAAHGRVVGAVYGVLVVTHLHATWMPLDSLVEMARSCRRRSVDEQRAAARQMRAQLAGDPAGGHPMGER